jgi:hypothetical protein
MPNEVGLCQCLACQAVRHAREKRLTDFVEEVEHAVDLMTEHRDREAYDLLRKALLEVKRP